MLVVVEGKQGQEPLTETVKRLLKEVPIDAHSHFVAIYLPGNLYEVKSELCVDGQTLPVHFFPATEDNPVGTVSIGYGVGNLESSTRRRIICDKTYVHMV